MTNKPAYEMAVWSAKDMFIKIDDGDESRWNKELVFAMQAIRSNNVLQNCSKDSILNSIINVASIGTTLNPALALAYLVPRKGKCCLDLSYRGLAGIAMDSGSVKHIAPRLVYEFDDFDFEEVDGFPHVKHKPCLNPPPDFANGPADFWKHLVCGYVVVILADGTRIITQPLPRWKLEKAMKTSKTSNGNTPWRTHPDEQCLKTLVKHAYKLLPQTDRMSQAVSVLNEHEGLDIEPKTNSVMDRFATPQEAEVVEDMQSCEFCEMIEGRHQDGCPDNTEGMP